MSKFPKRVDLEDRILIGVDEFNNGQGHRNIPFLSVAYLTFPEHSALTLKRKRLRDTHIRKGMGFKKEPFESVGGFRKRALSYLRAHPDFSYVTLNPSQDSVYFTGLRALATARLIYESAKLHLRYPKDKERLTIIHDGRPFHESAEKLIKDALAEYGLAVPLHFRGNADHDYYPVTCADRVAYCLGSLYFRNLEESHSRRWPFHRHKINLDRTPPELYDIYETLESLLEREAS